MENNPATAASPGGTRHLPWWRRARRRAYWLMLWSLLKVADLWPIGAGRRSCRDLARLAVRVRSREREQALANLELAFPDWSPDRRRQLLGECADALGCNLFDSLAAVRLLDRGLVAEETGNRAVTGSLLAELTRQAAKGRGVILLTGHVGCWELLGAWLAREIPAAGLGALAVVTGTIHNEPVQRIVQARRAAMGLKALPRSEGARPLVAHLKTGGVLAVLLDQNTDVSNLSVPFFGHPAPTPAGMAHLALKHGIPVVPVGLARSGKGHEVRWLPPLEPDPAPRGVAQEELRDFLTRCNAQLENLIRRNPAEWVWFHRRWDSE